MAVLLPGAAVRARVRRVADVNVAHEPVQGLVAAHGRGGAGARGRHVRGHVARHGHLRACRGPLPPPHGDVGRLVWIEGSRRGFMVQ